MSDPQYEYDIAISFVAKDEAIASQLADQFEGRLRVFLYSKQQEQLAGTDGEKTFNEVFAKQSRLVVVLYRDGWGQTPWTRIEETAIRNRAFDEGYDFVIFIPLDETPTVPKWLPRTQLWVGLSRWGISGAASVIDARFQELGGEPTIETLEHRAARVERELNYEKRRKQYLNSDSGVRGANNSFAELREAIAAAVPRLQAAVPSLRISSKQQERVIILLSEGPALSVNWRQQYSNTLSDSQLEASIWLGHPPFLGVMHYEQPNSIHHLRLAPDLDQSDVHAWAIKDASGRRLLGASEAAEYILTWWLDKATKHRKSR
jgi:hypothetical protein